MVEKDVYESLFEMYDKYCTLHMIRDSTKALLREQFTPKEAELAIKIGLVGGKIDELQEKTGIEKNRLEKILRTMSGKGTMWIDPGSDNPTYRTIGFAGPGIVETGGWGNIRFPNSVKIMKALHHFEVDVATKWLPAMGIPVARVWLTPDALPVDAKPTENVAEMIRDEGIWGISTCSCRLPHWIADPGKHCEHLLETCLFMGDMAKWGLENGMCREICYEEAVDILKTCNENGLVHTHDPDEFICNCCHDCCVFFVGINNTGAKILTPSEFIPQINDDSCTACSLCEKRCPVNAIEVDEKADVNLEKCLGCGVCFPTCPTESIQFVRRPEA